MEEKAVQQKQREAESEREGAMFLALEDEVTRSRVHVVTRSWKRQREMLPRASWRSVVAPHLSLANSVLDFCPPELLR